MATIKRSMPNARCRRQSPIHHRCDSRLSQRPVLFEQIQGNHKLIAVAASIAVLFCYFIGANDAANAWSSSVGSGAASPASSLVWCDPECLCTRPHDLLTPSMHDVALYPCRRRSLSADGCVDQRLRRVAWCHSTRPWCLEDHPKGCRLDRRSALLGVRLL